MMTKKLFTVTLHPCGEPESSFFVNAADKNAAAAQALKYGGVRGSQRHLVDIRVDGAEMDGVSLAGTGNETGLSLLRCGWIVTATSADGRVVETQYLVALEDADAAVTAASRRAEPSQVIALGASVDVDHLLRRKMKIGEVQLLGKHRVMRGKNVKRFW